MVSTDGGLDYLEPTVFADATFSKDFDRVDTEFESLL